MRRLGLVAAVLSTLLGGVARGQERTQPLLLVLRGRDAHGLERFIARSHRHWLDPHEFGQRFGAPPASVRRAARWLRANGLRVRHRYADRTLIECDDPPDAVARTFGVRLGRAHGRFRASHPPVVPAELGALDVLGLDGARTVPRFAIRPAARTPGNRFYISPADFRRMYGLDAPTVAPLTGAGQRISVPALGDADGTAVANFRAFFGLPPATVKTVIAGHDPGPNVDPSFRTEATLDVTWAGAVAPAAEIEVVRGSDLLVILGRQVNVNPAPIISISLAVCSSHRMLQRLARATDVLFREAAAQGQTVLVASGDTGAINCDRREADVLAASPHVTAVGGTEVDPVRDAAGNAVGYGSERAWNTGSAASGGGRATFFPRPFYQRGGTGRAVPDVAAPADDYPIGVGSRLVCCIGGTSAAAPAWAGIVALLAQARGQPLGLLNPTLYRLGRLQAHGGPAVFHDVTQGSSTVRLKGKLRPGFAAHRGYDLTTGWGSPDVPALLGAIGG